ncbi:putative nuclease HARBI1 [Rhopalosiphum padi]|uniref:putative nuclease HARBI1 n=1 Tax=Rhopalosiphum padi TaxID=40932 RepID=UPI00298E88C3|nr:putative nuclease HARBI1 [Rhopalosiphum padi]
MNNEISENLDFVELVNLIANEHRIPRIFRQRPDYFQCLRDFEFVERLRLSKSAELYVHDLIKQTIEHPTNRNFAVTSKHMLLMTLRYFASGSFLIVCGDFVGVHKSTASRTITRVSRAIARLNSQFIRFPETEEEITLTRQDFYAKCKFPRCTGIIDCTLIKIRSPGGEDAEIYRNRKQYFSFNVQAICNVNLKFINIVARWPGSSHDSTIFNNSSIRGKFERGEMSDSLLIGDSGYPIRPLLLTKLSIAKSSTQWG